MLKHMLNFPQHMIKRTFYCIVKQHNALVSTDNVLETQMFMLDTVTYPFMFPLQGLPGPQGDIGPEGPLGKKVSGL